MIDFIVHRSTDLVHGYGRRIWSTSAKLYIDLRADRIRPRVERLWTCFAGRPNWSLADVGAAENAVAAA